MVVFDKNGQGVWDFDFELLTRKTSKEFADSLKTALENEFGVLSVVAETYGDDNIYEVAYLTSSAVKTYTYNREQNEIYVDFILRSVIGKLLMDAGLTNIGRV